MVPYFENRSVRLYHGDCLSVMPQLKERGISIDLCLVDVPYGKVTACDWDVVIPMKPMWEGIGSLLKENGACCMFSSQPFTSELILSNLREFKYCWYWVKNNPGMAVHSKNRPMSAVEEICVFSKAPMGHLSLLGDRRMVYYPQGIKKAGKKTVRAGFHSTMLGARPNQVGKEYESFTGFHTNVLHFNGVPKRGNLHPTQKPVALLQYLIQCYTNEGELVLDFAAGSGSTGEACMGTNRQCILIEKEESFCEVIANRLSQLL